MEHRDTRSRGYVCERSLLSKQIVTDKKTNITLREVRVEEKTKIFLHLCGHVGKSNKNRFVVLHFMDVWDAKVVLING